VCRPAFFRVVSVLVLLAMRRIALSGGELCADFDGFGEWLWFA